MAERSEQVLALFRRALERAPAERRAYLDAACGGDAALRVEVESLLSARALDETFAEAASAPAAVPGLEPGAVLDGKYAVEALLGTGGMGAVFRARQVGLDRPVALKVVLGKYQSHDAAVARFKREAIAVARLRHHNIVTVYDFGIAPETGAYLVMEYLEGRSLREELRQHGRIPLPWIAGVVGQVAAALEAAHRAGVVHRDLKPDNVFLAESPDGPVAKVLDFGIAKLVDVSATGRDQLTGAGAALGTPAYMSPEQCEGRAVDARADVYALGCVLYELLTGRPPFRAPTVAQLLYRHVHEAPQPPSRFRSDLDAAVDAVVLRALAKDPAARFGSAAALARALEAVASGADTPEPGGATTTIGDDFPAATAIQEQGYETAPPSNLPAETTSFVGREREVADAREALAASRLLTLTGPGGIGKTRLALRAAAEALADTPDGVWLVELAPVADPDHVAAAVAAALDVRPPAGTPAMEAVVDAVRQKRLLLVLDNCEHLVEASAGVAAALLRASPGLRILATSREALGVDGEAVRPVPPLDLPAAGGAGSEAVRLFVERARLARPGFDASGRSAPAVEALCRRLEGIPLAIELAAARVRVLSVEQILAKTEDRFRLLTGGSRTTGPRHQALRATIDWSYELLTDDERALVGRLSVFAGGCTLEAAEAVCSGDPIDELAIVDLLTRLVDKSLVTVVESAGEPRYRMLETIRQYAREKLAATGGAPERDRAHCAWCVDLALRLYREFRGPRQQEVYDLLEVEHDNIRAALAWSVREGREAEAALRLSGALAMFWNTRGHTAEGARWTEEALAVDGAAPPDARANALYGLSLLAHNLGDVARARSAIEECLALRRATDDWSGIVRAINYQAIVLSSMAEYGLAAEVQREALALSRERGLVDEANYGVYSLGMIAYRTGDLGRAATWLEESLSGWRASSHHLAVASVLATLGELERLRDERDRSEARFEEAVEVARRVDAVAVAASARVGLGRLLVDRGEVERAASLFAESAPALRSAGGRDDLVRLVESCAALAARRGDAALAVSLVEAATACRDASRAPRAPVAEARLRADLEPARAALDPAELETATARGRAISLEEALELGLT